MSDVAHYDGLTYWGPTRPARLESILDLLMLDEGARALDVGCGRAELLLRLVERFGVAATGVDRSEAAVALAASEAARRVPDARVEILTRDVSDFDGAGGEHDFVSWLGGPHVGDGFVETVKTLASWARPGGSLLVGQGFWETSPPAAYLEATGIPADELLTHPENIALGRDAGLTLLYTCVSDRDEWDAFEGRILFNWEGRLARDSENRELQATVQRKRRWNDAQQRWGRGVMGYGLYLFRK